MDERIKSAEVVITDVKIPMGSLVVLMVKFAIAAIPAVFIIAFVYMIFAGILVGLVHH